MQPIFSHAGIEGRRAEWREKKENILGQLSLDELTLLKKHSIRLCGEKGQFIQLNQDGVARFYIVEQGVASAGISSNGSGDWPYATIFLLGPGDIFGQVFKQPLVIHSLRCLSESRLIGIDAETFKDVLSHHPEFMLRMIELQEERQRHLAACMHSLLARDPYARIAELLLIVREKFNPGPDSRDQEAAGIFLGEAEISLLSGIPPASVKRVISRLKRSGFLYEQSPGLLYIENEAGLRTIAMQGMRGFHVNR